MQGVPQYRTVLALNIHDALDKFVHETGTIYFIYSVELIVPNAGSII
jgi:hypothetical protein